MINSGRFEAQGETFTVAGQSRVPLRKFGVNSACQIARCPLGRRALVTFASQIIFVHCPRHMNPKTLVLLEVHSMLASVAIRNKMSLVRPWLSDESRLPRRPLSDAIDAEILVRDSISGQYNVSGIAPLGCSVKRLSHLRH